MTEWKPIPSLRFYEASEDGRIRSVSRIIETSNGQIRRYKSVELSPGSSNQFGHLKVQAAGKCRYVHALVAEAFCGPKPEGTQVRHLDGDCTNNAASNLTYGTPKQNADDKLRHGTKRKGESHPGAKLSPAQVAHIKTLIKQGTTQSAIAEYFGVSRTNISAIATGRSWA